MDPEVLIKRLKILENEENKIKKKIGEMEGSLVKKYVKCGKEKCKTCKFGKGHGPYYYLVTYKNGKQKWKYIGKNPRKYIKLRNLNLELKRLRNEKKKILFELKRIITLMLSNI